MRPNAAPASPGSWPQGYELEHLLGEGAGGLVYRALQRSTGQHVAVKFLRLEEGQSHAACERAKRRFRREMATCGRLSHPDIVGLIDYGESNDSLYSVFELVPGRTLAQVLQDEGALTLERSYRLLRQLLEVLVYSHAEGVIHRDLKPSNLMLVGARERERIKVLDFGVCAVSGAFFGNVTRLTWSNELIGTPAYAAPEQLRGDSSTAKSDLYSWGLIFLECLTGTNAMAGTSLGEIFQRQLSPLPVELPQRLNEHPLGMLLRWVLEKAPQRRAGSAQALLSRLDALLLDGLADHAGYFADISQVVQPESGWAITRTEAASPLESQRRQVVALCCRLVLRCSGVEVDGLLLDSYRGDLFALCQSTAEGFGGSWVAGCGDLLLFYFGDRRARDTDTRMALRAALELGARIRVRNAVLRVQSDVSVLLRIGLHTGLLTATERGNSAGVAHGTIAATASALALQGPANVEVSITTSDAFRQLAERFGEFGEGEPLALSWASQSLCTYRLLGESRANAFDRGVAPFVGRAEQLSYLAAASSEARERGRVVVVCGEAGIGKSRLAYEFAQLAAQRGQVALTLRCLPELTPIALAPVFELVREQLGFNGPTEPDCALIATVLAPLGLDLDTAVPLLCVGLSLPLAAPFAPLPHSPQLQRSMLAGVLVSLVRTLAQRVGYLCVEDLQWADARTLDWLNLYADAVEQHTGFVLVTTRPSVDWRPATLAHTLLLENLVDDEVLALVAGLPFSANLSETLRKKIVERADGVPLFVEELTRALTQPTAPGELREVPTTLRALLTSRLDGLGSAKEVAQFAAAIGREFDFDLLRASLAKDEATLLADIDQLISEGLVLVRRHVEQPMFLFRHALLRDAAYESLTAEARRTAHGAIANALAEFAGRVELRPDLLARHLELSGRPFEAQYQWLASGRKAIREAAYDEARRSLEHGLDLVRQCPDTAQRDGAELDLLNADFAAHVVKFGFGAPALPGLLARAAHLIDRGRASASSAFPLLWGQYLFNTARPHFKRAMPVVHKLYKAAEDTGDRRFLIAAQSAAIRCGFWMGEFDEGARHVADLDTLEGPALGRQLFEVIGEDSYSAAVSFGGLTALVRGAIADGEKNFDWLLRDDEQAKTPGRLEGSLAQAAFGYVLRGMGDPQSGELQSARALALRARDSALRLGFPFWAGYAGLMEASARVYMGDFAAVEEIRSTMQKLQAAGADIGFGWNHCTIAFGLLEQGKLDEAEAALRAARQHVARSDERFFAIEQLRIEARLLRAREPGNLRGVAKRLQDAIELAHRSGARLFLVRAQTDLARLDYNGR